jgi:hypothetical protein
MMKITKIAKFVNHEHLEHEGDSLCLKNSHNYFEGNKKQNFKILTIIHY